MVYLYAGMGVVMLTGIMAILEMGLSLTGQSILPMPVDAYGGSAEKAREISMMDSLDSIASGLEGIDICNALEVNPYVQVHVGSPVRKFLPKTRDLFWDNGCVMDYGSHQVLFMPSPDEELGPYLMVSCTEHDKSLLICPFEESSND